MPQRQWESTGQFGGGFRDALALIARALELLIGRLAGAVSGGDRSGAIRRAAADNIDTHLALIAVIQADDDRAPMEARTDETSGFDR